MWQIVVVSYSCSFCVLDQLFRSPVWVDGIPPDLYIGQLGENVIPKFRWGSSLANDPSALQWHLHSGFTTFSIWALLLDLIGFGFLTRPGCSEAMSIRSLLAVDGRGFVKGWECFLDLLQIGRRRWLRPSRLHTIQVHHLFQGVVVVMAVVQNVNSFNASLLHELLVALLLDCGASILFSGVDNDTPPRHQTISGDDRMPSPLGSANFVCFLQPGFFETGLVQGLLFQKVGDVNPQCAPIRASARGQRMEQAVPIAFHLDDGKSGHNLASRALRSC